MSPHDVWFAGTAAVAMTATLFTGTPTATGQQFTGTPTTTGQAAESQPTQECTPPPLPGKLVDVDLTDTAGAAPMRLTVKPAKVTAGTVSLRASNTGTLAHEVAVLPLAAGQTIGKRPVGADSRVTETGSLGEASHNCGAGEGGGIAPGSKGWTTLTLQPGRYELICNFPGHYAAGMRAELDVAQ
ncbi:plastocyanin/azurin family copper-binding protein [Nonomuraea sp. NPDC050451]|uniref:plastocyanin/azurin family copper-binding protein n=1 Tax=Nonomuraea sp. NPDC050451 TaxID=3364364 RepID=UPI0037ACCAB6